MGVPHRVSRPENLESGALVSAWEVERVRSTVPGGVWWPSTTPEGLQGGFRCLEVSGGPERLLRASRLDLGCLEVSGGPGRLLRASRLNLGVRFKVVSGNKISRNLHKYL